MQNVIDKTLFGEILHAVSQKMEASKEVLCKMDAELGDGDLGLTMARAFPAAEECCKTSEDTDIGRVIARCGLKMNSAAPSTMGTLMSSGMVYAGKQLSGKAVLTPADFAAFFRYFADGAANRGKASRGERTVLDSLYPAADAAEAACANGADLHGIAIAAMAGAKAGMEATREMVPKYGKAAVFADSARGKIDQGAMVGFLLAEGIADAIQ